MAFHYVMFATVIFVVISLCSSLPVSTRSEERSKSEIGDFVPESDKEFLVTDKSVKSEEPKIMVPIFGIKIVTDEHKILKRSPRAGVINVDNCPTGEYKSIGGCVPCDGNCNDINDIDYAYIESLVE